MKRNNKFATLLRLLREMREKRYFVIFIILFLLAALVHIFTNYAMAYMTQFVSDARNGLPKWVGIAVLCLSLTGMLKVVMMYMQSIMNEKVAASYRDKTFEAYVLARYSWLQNQMVGDIIGRVIEDIRFTLRAVVYLFPTLLECLFILLIMVVVFAWFDWRLAIAFVLPLLLMMPAQRIGDKKKQELLSRWLDSKGKANAFMQELINNKMAINSYQCERQVQQKGKACIHAYTDIGIRAFGAVFVLAIPSFVVNWLPFYLLAITAINLYASNNLSHIELTIVVYIGIKTTQQLEKIPNAFANLPQMLAAGSRLFEVWDAPVEEGSINACYKEKDIYVLPKRPVEIRLNEVVVIYSNNDTDKRVLDKVSFSINSGEHIAIVGPSGCGKSTLLHMITGLVEPVKGSVHIGGVELTKLSKIELRNHICYVTQEPFIFNGTIRENLQLEQTQITDEQLYDMLVNLGFDNYFTMVPDFLDRSIQENGKNLSGGQRQLISLARAFLKNSPIYLLDEVSANLDAITEQKVLRYINTVMRDRTVVSVCHRITMARNMDRIVVMNNGRIIEEGNHTTLVEQNGWYSLVCNMDN